MAAKPSSQLNLHDLLSRLTLAQAKELLGVEASAQLPRAGAESIDLFTQVKLGSKELTVHFPQQQCLVSLSVMHAKRNRLGIACNHSGERGNYYMAATLSMLLEEKLALGLSMEPEYEQPWELMDAADLEKRAVAEREKRAADEGMEVSVLAPGKPKTPWGDYQVTNPTSGKSYRVALRGLARGQSYCACPDFGKNRLGLCKHTLSVVAEAKRKFTSKILSVPAQPTCVGIYVRYDGASRVAVEAPTELPAAVRRLVAPWLSKTASTDAEMLQLFKLVNALAKAKVEHVIYPDAEEMLNHALHRHQLADLVQEIRQNPKIHPLRQTLLHVELLPYQLDGIAFAAGAGRAVLADEMGLGKTIQGLGVAEFLARYSGVRRVLVVCPASLKSQWQAEIRKFSDRTSQVVGGPSAERLLAYQSSAFFTLCNYEQVLRDHLDISRCQWDLIILDEAQRIKNWEAKTTQVIKSLRSNFALVLTGTPLENRLDDLFSIVGFIDDRRLGPAFQFVHGHRIAAESGRVLGYKNLDNLRALLKPILLRRTRISVSLDVPSRSTEILRIPATDEQIEMHGAHMRVVASIIRKPFMTQMDLLRLRQGLLLARMSANSTTLVDKQSPGYSSKLSRLTELLEGLLAEPERKIILFSEWTSMLNLVEPILNDFKAKFVRLDGKVPQGKRSGIVNEFQTNPATRCFLTTNAGSTGLNLQAADTVINLDLPWNPALLEQRIARAHRMGQKRKVQVYLLVTEGTIEEGILNTLGAKLELAAAALDADSDVTEVKLTSGVEELKRRLEILLGAVPEAPRNIRQTEEIKLQGTQLDPQQKAAVAAASGQLLTSAFHLLSQLAPQVPPPDANTVTALHSGLAQCTTPNAEGLPQLTITLPNAEALQAMAQALAALMAIPQPKP